VFQPAVAAGRVYIGTDSGTLICLETGDGGDDGWPMWGADAAHNGKID
jgi:outer membrane protein assembly factor BamB